MKPIQVRYRLWYMLREKIRTYTGHSYLLTIPKKSQSLILDKGIAKPASFQRYKFIFLNKSHSFGNSIDWNYDQYGKLWAYNLNYFDYLLQEEMTKVKGLKLINEFIDGIEKNREGLEPYPISLRGMNWIKFLSYHKVADYDINGSLYAQYKMLLDKQEYHLLGNHLMENGCSLLFGAFYFRDEELLIAAKEILDEQLDEQILADGGHFERSTMYHHIMFERLLDCYNLVVHNFEVYQVPVLKYKLQEKLSLMRSWAEEISMGDGEMPLLNDSTVGIAPSLEELIDYAERLNIRSQKIQLSESGYRKYKEGPFELLCDVGNIGPDYIPGHAHSDTFSFVLYCEGKPVIVDPGISTYVNSDRRQLERSTAFHNTVQLEDKEQSEVWSAFRVGRRAKVHDVRELQDEERNIRLSAWHDGYQQWGVRHKRSWSFEKGGKRIIIRDQLIGNASKKGFYRLHFHYSQNDQISIENNKIRFDDLTISFNNNKPINVKKYDCPKGYNSYIKCKKIEMPLVSEMTTYIDYTHEDTISDRQFSP